MRNYYKSRHEQASLSFTIYYQWIKTLQCAKQYKPAKLAKEDLKHVLKKPREFLFFNDGKGELFKNSNKLNIQNKIIVIFYIIHMAQLLSKE